MKSIGFIMLLFVLVLSVLTINGQSEPSDVSESKLTRDYTKGLSTRTIKFLERHSCVPQLLLKEEISGTSHWTNVVLNCKNLDQNVIQSVLCKKTCVDPDTCMKLDKLKAVPVTFGHQVTSMNITSVIEIPVACKCIPKRKSNACRRKRFVLVKQ